MAEKRRPQGADGRTTVGGRPGIVVFGFVLGLALAGLLPFVSSTPASAASSFHMYASATGWALAPGKETNPGPGIVVNQGELVDVTLTSEDLLSHGLWIDYDKNGVPSSGDFVSPKTSGTITFTVPVTQSGTFTYYDESIALNQGTWGVLANSPPTVSIHTPAAGTSWTGGVGHGISMDVFDPNNDPVQVWVNYSYDGGASHLIRGPFPAGANPNVVSWTPTGFSSMNTIVSVDAKDNRGGATHVVSSPFEVDSTAPTIATFVPTSGANGVVLDALIQINWSEAMNRVTASGPSGFGMRLIDGPWLKGTGAWSQDATRFTFQPAAALDPGAKYEVQVNRSATDHSDPGNAFAAGPFMWTFTAGSTFGSSIPPAPTSVTATPTDGGVEVTWTPVSSPNVAGYHVYRGPSSTGPFLRLTTSPILVTGPMKYRDTTAQVGHSYSYTVTAVNATGGESAYAPVGSVTIPTDQNPPLFDPVPWAVAGVTLGVILGALYGMAWRRKPA